jgi:hypothetical protein
MWFMFSYIIFFQKDVIKVVKQGSFVILFGNELERIDDNDAVPN